ncbi:class I SAM-dependent methyltransferase [Corallincola luteus]|uniref:Class I SAM-dependent methyltransferase n=2 Tax=Corallincola luteus TaxID=1775177 RepID=A0ABY2AIK7_9GAMM|nr:class I SAM-dependent methyltransferase [Corallincola luteus]
MTREKRLLTDKLYQGTDTAKPSMRDKFAKQLVFRLFNEVEHGTVMLLDGTDSCRFGEGDADVTVEILDPSAYRAFVFGGSIGAAEAYIRGAWRCDHLTRLIQIFAANLPRLERLEAKFSWLQSPLRVLSHWRRRNSRRNARQNIGDHYDLSNDFYQLFLDPKMMYSSAIYRTPDTSLDEAAEYKLQVVCEKLALQPSDHLLEVGTGWGGLAIYAAEHYGCHVTTTTISEQQYRFAQQRIREKGLEHQITLLKQDYRELTGKYDKIVSIEMIEAVGHQYLPSYFEKISSLLKPQATALIQAITISDQRYTKYVNSVDFIQKYIFPGGCLPSVERLSTQVSQHSDMVIRQLEDIGLHYATTLAHWREGFFANLDAVREMGFSEQFVRLWQYYLCYCEGAFRERVISTVQVVLSKPEHRADLAFSVK